MGPNGSIGPNRVQLFFSTRVPHPPYSADLALSDYWLFARLKKILQGKRFGSNEEVIAKTEAYFESKDESFYKKCLKNTYTFLVS